MHKKIFCAVLIALIAIMVAGNSEAAGRARIPKTGETANTYGAGSDGVLEKGVAWPSPRFTDNLVAGVSNGTVTDNLTGLIWLKNANCLQRNWSTALASANSLANGACGLTDGSVAGDWRLPSLNELDSLLDLSQSGPALPAGHPFTNVQSTWYWSSTTVSDTAGYAWIIGLFDGFMGALAKTNALYVWPVRGGQ